ncbi:MAG: alpha/beta hydrolase [Patescibacteria group bacterium]
MSKKVYIIHGWESYPDDCWFPWIKKELESKGIEVEVPAMPNPEMPLIDSWVPYLSSIVPKPNEDIFLIGHSIGCQTILRYLANLSETQKVGGAVFVAGWFTLTGLETPEEEELAKPWLDEPIDFEKVRSSLDKSIAIFSNDDPFVPLSNKDIFEQELNSQAIVLSDKGHFSRSEGVYELPEALEAILIIMK